MQSNLLIYRRITQSLGLISLILIPILNIFRLDLANEKIILFGHNFFVGQSYLLVTVFIALIVLLVITSRMLGRIFCGWFCPQNTWAEMGDALLKKIKQKNKRLSSYAVLVFQFATITAITMLFCLTLILYFIPPVIVWGKLINLEFGGFINIAITKLSVFGLLNMLIVRHTFCWSVCPYALFQRFLTTKNTLQIKFADADCSNCGGCDRACFMNLNPRKMDVNSCINCGDCITACEKQAARRRVTPSLGFSFGDGMKKFRELLVPDGKTAAVLVVLLLFAGLTVYGFISNKQLDVMVTKEFRNLAAVNNDGSVTNHYLLRVSTSENLGTDLTFAIKDFPGELSITPEQITPPIAGTSEVKMAITGYGSEYGQDLIPLILTVTSPKIVPIEIKMFFFVPEK